MDAQGEVIAAHAAALRARQLREAFQQAKATAIGTPSSLRPASASRLPQPDVSAATAFWQRQLSAVSTASATGLQPWAQAYAAAGPAYGLGPTSGLIAPQQPFNAWAAAAPGAAVPQAVRPGGADAASSKSGRSRGSSSSVAPHPRRPSPIVFFAAGPDGAADDMHVQQLPAAAAAAAAAALPGDYVLRDPFYGLSGAPGSGFGRAFGLGHGSAASGSASGSVEGRGAAAAVAEGAAAIRLQVEAMRQQWQAEQQRQRGERRAQQWQAADGQPAERQRLGGGGFAADGAASAAAAAAYGGVQGDRAARASDAASSSSSSTAASSGVGAGVAGGASGQPGPGKENRGPHWDRDRDWAAAAATALSPPRAGAAAAAAAAAEPGRRRRHSSTDPGTGPNDDGLAALYSFGGGGGGGGGSRGPGQGVEAASAMLRAIAAATGRRPLDPVITASGRRPAPPPPGKPLYTPAPDPAADATRLPVFVSAAALPPGYRPPAQHRRRRWSASGPAAATATATAAGGPAGAAGAGPAAASAAPNVAHAATTASDVPAEGGTDTVVPSLTTTAAAAQGLSAAAAPAAEARSRRSSSSGAASAAPHAPGAAASAAAAAASAAAAPPVDPWSGRPHVYLLRRDVDVYLPDVNPTRPRPASAVMGRSKRGVVEGPAAAVPAAGAAQGAGGGGGPTRPALRVDDTLLRRRVPAASFAAAPYKPPARSPSPQKRRRRRAWELPGEGGRSDVSDMDAAAATHAATDAGGDGSMPSATTSPTPWPPSGGGSPRGSVGSGGGGADVAWRSDRSRSRSRSAVLVTAGEARTTIHGGVGAAARGRGRAGKGEPREEAADGGGGRGDALRQTTAEPLRVGPAVGFGRAPRFAPGAGQEDIAKARRARSSSQRRRAGGEGEGEVGGGEGVSTSRSRSRGRHRHRSGSRRRRRQATGTGGDAATSGRSASRGGGGGVATAEDSGEQLSASPAHTSESGSGGEEPLAPLRHLDAAYAAVLPRVTGASFAASSSRRFDWLPELPATATAAAAAAAEGRDAATQRRRQQHRRRRRRWALSEAGAGGGGGGADADAGTGAGGVSAGEQTQPEDGAVAAAERGAQSEGAAGAGGGDAAAARSGAGEEGGRGAAAMSAGGSDSGSDAGMGDYREPMAPLEGLAAAVDAVRPRVRATTFAHRSVAEQMRRELQARRERQLEKARALQEQLRRQPVDELWPAVAAQLRRERLAALGERRRRRWSDQDRDLQQQQQQQMEGSQSPQEAGSGATGARPDGATGSSSGAGHRSYSYSPSPSPVPAGADAGGSSPARAAASPSLLLPVGSPGREQERPSPDRSAVAGVGATPARPPLPRARGLFLTAMKSPSPHSSPPRAGAASPPAGGGTADTPTRAGVVGAGAGAGVGVGSRRSSAALLPERPPHFLATTRAALASLEAPMGAAAAGAGAAVAVAGAGAGAGTGAAPPPVPPIPNYGLVEKRAPAVGFSPARASTTTTAAALQPSPRYSREPGPGHYEPSLADGAISRHTRAATPVFGSSRRPVVPYLPGVDAGPDSPTRAAASAAADVAWLDRDPAAALDYTRRRAPVVVIAPPPAEREREGGDQAGQGEGEEDLGPEGARLVLDVRYTLVEPRVRGMPRMRPPPEPSATVSDEDGVPLERWAGPDNPWDLDLPTRRRRPAWGFPAVGHLPLAVAPTGRELLDLRPVYDLVSRRIVGVPDFARTPDRYAGEEQQLRRAQRQPTALDYEAEAAWAYLCRHVPGVIMRLAAPRWPPPRPEDEDGAGGSGGGGGGEDDGSYGLEVEVQARQRRQAYLELGAAIDYIRPRPPAWTFAPLVTLVRRHDGPASRGRGFGPLLSFDINIGLVKRRLRGALPWAASPARQGLLDPRLLAAARHLAPGTYEVELAWRAVQAAPHVPQFQRFTGHGLIEDVEEPFAEEDGGELPYGARLVLQVGAAKDAVLRRRDAAPGPQRMSQALGRAEDVVGLDPAYTHPTAHLPLPDPGLDEPTRLRTRNVVIEAAGPCHLPPAPEPSAHEALRGPGAYYPEGAEQALAAVGPAARAVDFSKGPERRLFEEDKADPEEVLEGNRLVLSPHTALDYVRPRPHVALIPPLVPHPEREPDPAFHAVYDVDPGLDLVLRRARGHPGFDGGVGRDPPLPAPYGIEPRPAACGGHVGHGLAAEDVALTALAGFRRAPGGPDFASMIPREVPKPADYDGQRLDLDAPAALDALRRRPPQPAAMGLQRGRWEAGPHPDWDLTAWLDYNPTLDAVRRRLVAQLAVPLGRQIGREQAARADPRVGEAATGDLDAGCYRVRHQLVMRSAPAIDFGRGADPRHTGLQPGAVPSDPDAGNVLLLEPRQPPGWQPPPHQGRPWRQPFGRGEGRWERPFADPAYRFVAAAGDEGGALLLRHSADDLAALRARATAANAPAAAWGWMTSRRDAQVLQPDPAVPPPPRAQPRAQPRGATLIARELPPRNAELELIKNNPPNDARVVAIRRRDRVLARMVAKIKAQRAAVADV